MASMTVKEFQKKIREELQAVATETRLNLDNSSQRGQAFQIWAARTIENFESTYDTAADDAVLRSNDLCADLVFDDSASRHLLICQCKYQAFGTLVDEGQVNDFFHRHNRFRDRAWVTKHGSKDAQLALQDYGERLSEGYSISLYFITTGEASERTQSLAQKCTNDYRSAGEPVTCELLDFSRLKDYYVRSLSLEQSIPDLVEIDLPSDQFFYKDTPYPTVVAVVKANSLRNLSLKYKQALYAWNIRGYLGNRGINRAISETAAASPQDFFYFNNGVSAICTNLEVEGNKVRASKFQVINGAQTVSSLASQAPNSDVEVLFRLTQTKSVSTEKGFNRQIIQYNNSQNAVKLSDFRSNDDIQIWLERELPSLRHRDVVPKIHYLRKRAVGRKGLGQGLRLEELAKTRYAFLYEPTIVHASPKGLWTLEEDEGFYEKAFGIDGELQSAWSDESLDECLLAIILLIQISEESKRLARTNEDMQFLPRLKYHALSLLGQLVRRRKDVDITRLLRNHEYYDRFWSESWLIVRGVLTDVYTAAEEDGSTMFAFVRSGERWARMQKRLSRHLAEG